MATGHPGEVSIRRIAEEAGVALSTVQYYFPNKEELLESLLDDYYERLAAVASSLPPPLHGGAREWIRHVVGAHFRFARSERLSLRLRTHLNTDVGRLPARRDHEILQPALNHAVSVLGGASAEAVEGLRLIVLSMSFLITKYAMMTDDELRAATGCDADGAPDVIEQHLAAVAERFLMSTAQT